MRSRDRVCAIADQESRAGDRSFTVVIPAKNEAAYIGRSLRSLRADREARNLDFHIVVVDCGSSDETVAEASDFADTLITDCHLASHSIGCARNIGAAATSSEFLFHTDADVLVPDLASLLDRATAVFNDPRVVALTVPVMPYPWDSPDAIGSFTGLAMLTCG